MKTTSYLYSRLGLPLGFNSLNGFRVSRQNPRGPAAPS